MIGMMCKITAVVVIIVVVVVVATAVRIHVARVLQRLGRACR
jgi:hypothetical protein